MRIAHSLPYAGVFVWVVSLTETLSGQSPPPTPQRPPWTETPIHVTCDACWDRDPPWTDKNTCENITLPQTGSACGNK